MPIKQTKVPKGKKEKKEEQKPLINITLPVPDSMDPKSFLPVGQHNACTQKNFQEVSRVLMIIINNQKLMGKAVSTQAEAIENLKKSNKKKHKRELFRNNIISITISNIRTPAMAPLDADTKTKQLAIKNIVINKNWIILSFRK